MLGLTIALILAYSLYYYLIWVHILYYYVLIGIVVILIFSKKNWWLKQSYRLFSFYYLYLFLFWSTVLLTFTVNKTVYFITIYNVYYLLMGVVFHVNYFL